MRLRRVGLAGAVGVFLAGCAACAPRSLTAAALNLAAGDQIAISYVSRASGTLVWDADTPKGRYRCFQISTGETFCTRRGARRF